MCLFLSADKASRSSFALYELLLLKWYSRSLLTFELLGFFDLGLKRWLNTLAPNALLEHLLFKCCLPVCFVFFLSFYSLVVNSTVVLINSDLPTILAACHAFMPYFQYLNEPHVPNIYLISSKLLKFYYLPQQL